MQKCFDNFKQIFFLTFILDKHSSFNDLKGKMLKFKGRITKIVFQFVPNKMNELFSAPRWKRNFYCFNFWFVLVTELKYIFRCTNLTKIILG